MQNDLNKLIGNATKWSGITEIIAKLISPLVNMVLARLLSPEAFGIVATITMVISFAEIFTDAGFQKYLIQHEFKDENELDQSTNVAFWTNFSISSLIVVLIFLFKDSIAVLVGSPGLGNSISIASILIIIAALSSIQMARYKRAFNFKELFFVRVGAALIPVVVTLPLAAILRNYWALLIGTFTSQLFTAIALTVKSKWRPAFFFSFDILKKMFSFSAWTLLESISIWLTSYIGVFIVGSYLDDYYLGLYKTSISTVNSYMSIITAAITPVLFSALSRYQNDEHNFQKTYYSFQRTAAILIIPMGFGIYLFSDLVTSILLGDQWSEASNFIGLWGLTSAFSIVLSHFSSEVFRSKGVPKVSLFMQCFHLLFLIPTLILSQKHGFDTLCLARCLIRLQLILTAVSIMQVKYKFRFLTTLKNIAPMILSSLIMSVTGYFLKRLSLLTIWQLFSVFICVIVYFASLLILFPSIRKELTKIKFINNLLAKSRKPLYKKTH